MRWLLPIVLVGCVNETKSPGVMGTPADVTTQPGIYVGYRVGGGCQDAAVSVVGTGSVTFDKITDLSAATSDLRAQLADLTSVWGYGAGLVCSPGLGSELDTDDWRVVDELIARTGAWLHAHDYGFEIDISVGSIPVPVSQ